MAKETVTKSDRFYCISLIPDFCKTPVGPATPPLPYTIKGEFKETSAASKNVKSHSEPIFLHDKSFIPTVTGDEPGVAKGIKSNTVGKRVESMTFSTSYGSNGTKTTQEGRIVWMNDRNTIGQIYERGGKAAKPLQNDLTSKFEATFNETGEKVKSSLSALSSEINQKTKAVGNALTDAGNSLLNQISSKIEDTRVALQPLARKYKNDVSASMHQFGQDAMETGGKVTLASGGVALAGLGVAATGIGAPVGAAMEVGAAAGGTVGGVVTVTGAAAESGATLLDKAADYILDNKKPDVLATGKEIGGNLAEGYIMRKLGPLLGKIMPKKMQAKPQNEQPPKKVETQKPHSEQPPNRNGQDGGKEKDNNRPKQDKHKDECPKTCANPNIPASEPKSAHYGTGEEMLYQTDFSLGGALPLSWTRCYRSGSETEDWGMLGARWAIEFTESLSVSKKGIIFHDATGRCVRLPLIKVGEQYQHHSEAFTIERDNDNVFTMTWRDGEQHQLQRGANGWLPHGHDGVNMMLKPQAPLLVRRYHLVRKQARDGRGYTVERIADAKPGAVLLRIRNDDGRVLEAMRADDLSTEHLYAQHLPLIGHVDEVMPDGSRVCHVRYAYALEGTAQAYPPVDYFEAPQEEFIQLPPRANLMLQTDRLQQARSYHYTHHLLRKYSTYGGTEYKIDWISLAALRERWQGGDAAALTQAEIGQHFPIYLNNSYQARVTATSMLDGSWQHQIEYLNMDTTLVTEPDGVRYEFEFNEQWLVTRVLQYLPGQSRPVMQGKRRWNQHGLLLEEIDAERNLTRYEYDAAGNVTAQIDANCNITRTFYNSENLPICFIDALGHSTHLRYDNAGRVLSYTDALRQETQYEYDLLGRLVAVVDAKGGRSQMDYDKQGNLLRYQDCSGFATSYQYDAASNVIAQTNPLGQTTAYDYDLLNRLIRVRLPDNTYEELTYDADDNLVCHRDGKGQTTQYRYNGQGQPLERIDANGAAMHYRYDAALRLAELINGNKESYRFTYHPQGWLASETGFDGKTTQYAYDAAGRLNSSTSAGQKTEFLRDSLGQLLAKMNADGNLRYAYDAVGRLTAVSAPHAENHFQFDAIGQLVQERSRIKIKPESKRPLPQELNYEAPATELAFALTHAYDALGNRIQTVLPNGRKVDTLRYGSGHWHGSLWQGESFIDLERDGLHRESSRHMGANLRAYRRYDAQSRLAQLDFQRANKPLQQRQYQYDLAGNLTQIVDSQRSFLHYQYDPLGQLLRAAQPGLVETFAFDPAGNLLEPAPEPRPEPVRERYLQNQPEAGTERPQLSHIARNLLQSWQGFAYEFDVQGNTVLKRPLPSYRGIESTTISYAYDADNRLQSACKKWPHKQNVAEYYYDAFNRRVAKRVMQEIFDPSQTKVSQRKISTQFFVWDGDTLLQEIEQCKTTTYLYEPESFVPVAQIISQDQEEIYALGTVHLPHIADWDMPSIKNSANAHVYAWQNWQGEHKHAIIRAQREIEAERNAKLDQRYFYQCDHLGTPLDLLDVDGNTVWAAKYKAWGGVFQSEVAKANQPLRFQGQYFDAETGLHYNRHRYYDPETARFVTQDPIGLDGGVNLYQYAPNPNGWIDPLGLAKMCCCGDLFVDADTRWTQLMNEPNTSKAMKGWIQNQIRQVASGKQANIKAPPGYELAHRPRFESERGYDYSHADPMLAADHRGIQHRYWRKRGGCWSAKMPASGSPGTGKLSLPKAGSLP